MSKSPARNRWKLAQDYQLANQLQKKSILAGTDLKSFYLARYSCTMALFGMVSKFKEITNTSKILEVGSGPHGVSFYYPQGIKVALDPLAVFYRQEFAFIQDKANVSLVQGRGENLPFPAKSFDVVVSDNVLDHTANPRKVLSEIYAVLKDDGLLLFTVNVHHWFYRVSCAVFRFLFTLKIVLNFPNFKTHTFFFTPAKINRLIRRNGFKILSSEIPIHTALNKLFAAVQIFFKPFRHVLSTFVCSKQMDEKQSPH